MDGVSLKGNALASLRRQTAWVDPAIQLWNRSLFDNLRYGESEGLTAASGFGDRGRASSTDVLEKLPDGLQSLLGEGGALTSGGEGQRVRFGRALMRRHVRLVIMDEPFRGLDRQQRHDLLVRARTVWRDATLLCVTHDIGETQAFDRVIVLEAGCIVEDGSPIDLAQRAGSTYARLLEAEQTVSALWSAPGWRRLRLDNGSLVEDPPTRGDPMDCASGLAWPVTQLGGALELLARAGGLRPRSGAPLASPPPTSKQPRRAGQLGGAGVPPARCRSRAGGDSL